jgi:hypothetical protein
MPFLDPGGARWKPRGGPRCPSGRRGSGNGQPATAPVAGALPARPVRSGGCLSPAAPGARRCGPGAPATPPHPPTGSAPLGALALGVPALPRLRAPGAPCCRRPTVRSALDRCAVPGGEGRRRRVGTCAGPLLGHRQRRVGTCAGPLLGHRQLRVGTCAGPLLGHRQLRVGTCAGGPPRRRGSRRFGLANRHHGAHCPGAPVVGPFRLRSGDSPTGDHRGPTSPKEPTGDRNGRPPARAKESDPSRWRVGRGESAWMGGAPGQGTGPSATGLPPGGARPARRDRTKRRPASPGSGPARRIRPPR